MTWVLVGLCALGVALRLTALGTHSLWYDEGATLFVARAADPFATLARDRHPPLSFLAFRIWTDLFGEDDVVLRLLPALLSCLSLTLFARLARRWLATGPALLAVALQATAPLLVWIAHEVRMYAFVELGVLVAWTGLDATLRGRPGRGFALAWLGTTIAFGSHYYGGLVGVGLLGAALVARHRRTLDIRSAALVVAAPAMALVVWLPWLLAFVPRQLATPWGFQARTTPRELAELPIRFLLADVDVLPEVLHPLGYVLGAALLVGIGTFAVRLVMRRGDDAAPRIAALALGPILGALAIGVVGPLSFGPRYLLAAQPAIAMAIAAGLAALRPRPLRITLSAVGVAGCLCLTLLHASGNRREDFRTATAELIAEWRPGEPVLVVTGTPEGFSEATVRHYLRGRPEIEAALRPSIAARRLVHDLPPGTRVHVVYRTAAYAKPELDALRDALETVHRGPERFRIAYLCFRTPEWAPK